MGPAIRDGDLVTFAPVRPQQIRRGDVLLYASERGLTAHRAVGWPNRSRAIFPIQGDAPGSPREQVSARQVLGRVESVEREGRQVSVHRPFARQLARITWVARRVLTRMRGKKAPRSRQTVAERASAAGPILGLSGKGWTATHCPTRTSAPGTDREQYLLSQDRA